MRERDDFQSLTERILADINPDRNIYLAPALLAQLSGHPWPGNLRQLASMLRTASAMLNPNEDCINWPHLPDDLVEELNTIPQEAKSAIAKRIPQNLKELSLAAIQRTLESNHGNVSAAARQLGISRQTLYRKLNS